MPRLRHLPWMICLLLWCRAPGLASGQEPDAMRSGRCATLVYSANPHYPPYHWAKDATAFEGASIELLKLVAPPGVRLKPVVYPWKRVLESAARGEIDLVVSLRATPERSGYLQFSTHRSFPNPIVVFVRKDKVFPYSGWEDLRGRRGGISAGDTFGGGFDEYWRESLRMEEAPDMERNFQKLDSGRIDYFVTSKYVGLAYAATHPMEHGFTALSPPISEQDIHFGFSRASPCAGYLEQMNRRLKELDKKGMLEKLLQKHLRRIQSGAAPQPE